jgi:DNA repair ATPase RecN
MNVKKVCAFIAVFSIILYAVAKETESFSGINVTCNGSDDSFDEALSRRFKGKDKIWLVLGNRGTANYYIERFSKNWIFWADHSAPDNIGISGDFFNLENWKQVSKLLPEKVSYIAVDFNDLVNHPKRNKIIKASKDILKSEGIFCIEDVYDNKKKRFKHFTKEDFEELSDDFYIEYAYWDGYISALPYTSDQSANKRSDMYKGLETMILRLASADAMEKRKILPYITDNLYKRTFSLKESLVKKLVRNIVNTSRLNQLIQSYENAIEEEQQLQIDIEKEKKDIEVLKKDIETYSKIASFSNTMSSSIGAISKNMKNISKGFDFLANSKKNSKSFSFMSKVSKLFSKANEEVSDYNEKLKNKKNELSFRENNLASSKIRIELVKSNIKNLKIEIIRCNEESFYRFEREKYLKTYITYKKTELDEIIKDCKESNEEFWDEYDSFWSSISETEILAKELEKSWSPDVIVQNVVPIELIESADKNRMNDTSKIVILFTKK